MNKDNSFTRTILRIAAFSVLWWLCVRILALLEMNYGDDNGAAYMLLFSAIQFPIILVLYCVLDYSLKNKLIFTQRNWLLVPVGLLAAAVLYIPFMILLVSLPRLLT